MRFGVLFSFIPWTFHNDLINKRKKVTSLKYEQESSHIVLTPEFSERAKPIDLAQPQNLPNHHENENSLFLHNHNSLTSCSCAGKRIKTVARDNFLNPVLSYYGTTLAFMFFLFS